ncbi:hypothetical protein PVL29_026216 [Vitis rotundifolia]|uniref:MADS-box domain-containing protein n=1 Tax=Vitis rotundifolia TaxID=103349 RepID=A0AA38YLV9_VITRO|nr:hypothetical protein PVL29_026216 [Vitis rotundifolia]
MEKKQTKGRQKIEMKRIPKEEDPLITFLKHRFGIYNKVSELSTLCGAGVGVLVFSPAGKAFLFGHSSIETITNKVLYENPPPNDNTLNLEREKILRKKVPNRSKGWWEKPITNELRTRASSSSLPFSIVNQTPPTNPFSMTKVEQKY